LIKIILSELEQKNDIKLLFCVESGSRALGTDTKYSDYDIKGIFKKNNSKKKSPDIIKETNSKAKGFDVALDFEFFEINYYIKVIKSGEEAPLRWLHS
jgi:predicted nucleotidyltransferase